MRRIKMGKRVRKRAISALVVFLGVVAFVCFVQTQANALVIQPGPDGKDAWVNYNYKDVNYGNDTSLQLWRKATGSGKTRKKLFIEFADSLLPDVPTNNILSAELKLYKYYDNVPGSCMDVMVGRVTTNWNETGITWNNQPSYVTFPPTVEIKGPTNVWYSWDITEIVQGWVGGTYANYGVEILGWSASTTRDVYFYSGDYGDSDKRPKLVMDVIPEPASALLLGAGLVGLAGFGYYRKCRA